MRKMFQKLWQDDAGIVALEYLLVATIVGLGLVVGLSNLEIALDVELSELANAITALDQGYSFVGVMSNNGSYKAGTCATDMYGSQSIGSMSATCAQIWMAVP
jgi:Flp pilus assembly pilin Flp